VKHLPLLDRALCSGQTGRQPKLPVYFAQVVGLAQVVVFVVAPKTGFAEAFAVTAGKVRRQL